MQTSPWVRIVILGYFNFVVLLLATGPTGNAVSATYAGMALIVLMFLILHQAVVKPKKGGK
jgi:hypothetical protein